jgi:hypothetical protein
MKKIIWCLSLVLLAGCASVAVSQKALEQKTEFALGLPPGSYTITSRQNEGVQTRYTVKTNMGQQYNCYVDGSISVIGPVVSDAICAKPGQPAFNPLLEH